MTTTSSSGAGTRERITEATLRLMAECGFAGVTMTAVANTAGVSRQTLYNHFPDVDSIVAEAVETHQVESLGALRRVLTTIESPTARLEHLVRHSAAVAVHHHPAVGLEHGLSAETQATLSKHDAELLAIIEATLQTGKTTGEFRSDLDVHRDALLVRRMLDAIVEMSSADPDGRPATVAGATRTLLASVGAANANLS